MGRAFRYIESILMELLLQLKATKHKQLKDSDFFGPFSAGSAI